MPALDFPANPTNGQAYANWIYSSSKGAWQAKPMTNKVTTSGVAPASPSNGDEWYNTEDGNIYVYYYDGDSYQWVQVKSDATLSSTLGNRVTTLESIPNGLVDLTPTSVTVGSGSGTVNSLGQITLTGASSATINGVFTSTYLNYRMVCSLSQTAEAEIRLRYSAAGVVTSTNYYQGTGRVAGNVLDNYSVTNGAQHIISLTSGGGGTNLSVDIFRPNIATTTGFTSLGSGLGSGYGITLFGGGNNQNTTAFDGLHIYPATGTISGTIQVYGYR